MIFVKKKFFKLLIIINTPHTKKDLFQLSSKYFLLFMYVPTVADINKNIPPINNVLGKKKTPVKKEIPPNLFNEYLFILERI